MRDSTIQSKLNQMATLADELAAEAVKRWGNEAILFFEAGGRFYLMAEDNGNSTRDRQEGIRFSSDYDCDMEAGAW